MTKGLFVEHSKPYFCSNRLALMCDVARWHNRPLMPNSPTDRLGRGENMHIAICPVVQWIYTREMNAQVGTVYVLQHIHWTQRAGFFYSYIWLSIQFKLYFLPSATERMLSIHQSWQAKLRVRIKKKLSETFIFFLVKLRTKMEWVQIEVWKQPLDTQSSISPVSFHPISSNFNLLQRTNQTLSAAKSWKVCKPSSSVSWRREISQKSTEGICLWLVKAAKRVTRPPNRWSFSGLIQQAKLHREQR